MHGFKIDQIATPKEIDSSFLPPSRRIVDVRCGGSFTIVLDSKFHSIAFVEEHHPLLLNLIDCLASFLRHRQRISIFSRIRRARSRERYSGESDGAED